MLTEFEHNTHNKGEGKMGNTTVIRKVIAYITRLSNQRRELLVHIHKDYPEAGVQVPAGTVEENETIEEALYREIKEESGLTEFISRSKLKEYVYYHDSKDEYHERHVFQLEIVGEVRERWEHIVNSLDQDAGLTFCYYWVPLEAMPKLAANQDDYINFLV